MYTTTTQDTPEYKPILCGRTSDIAVLIDYVVQGHSVALFGERKIGKTSLLYVTRDIINGSISGYQANLIDSDLRNAIADLQAKIPHYKSCYINFQSFLQYDFEAFVWKLYKGGQEAGLLPSVDPGTSSLNYKNMEIFEKLNTACSQGRFVVLIDEIEVIENFRFQERMKIVRNLRNATSYSNLCFIIAGAENWYDHLKDESSPFSGVLKKYTITVPSLFPMKLHLMREPLRDYLSSPRHVDTVVATVLDWTACKPFYVQVVCDTVVRTYQKHLRLPENWQELVQKDVYSNTAGEVLSKFYGDDNIDKLAQNILALLANKPNLTARQIAQLLGYDKQAKVVIERLDDLIAFGKISKQDEKYQIVGTLIEQWGHDHTTPTVKSPWPQRIKIALKLVAVLVILAFGIWAFTYANPSNKMVSVKFAHCMISLEVPGSIEADQTGTIAVYVQNNSPDTIAGVHILLTSPNIDYQYSNSNRLTFKSLNPEEQQSLLPTFVVHSSFPNSPLTSQITVTEDGIQSHAVHSFDIPIRYPIRKYSALVGSLIVALLGFITAKDIWQFGKNVASSVFPGKNDSAKSDG